MRPQDFQAAFTAQAASVQGSGWAWLGTQNMFAADELLHEAMR